MNFLKSYEIGYTQAEYAEIMEKWSETGITIKKYYDIDEFINRINFLKETIESYDCT